MPARSAHDLPCFRPTGLSNTRASRRPLEALNDFMRPRVLTSCLGQLSPHSGQPRPEGQCTARFDWCPRRLQFHDVFARGSNIGENSVPPISCVVLALEYWKFRRSRVRVSPDPSVKAKHVVRKGPRSSGLGPLKEPGGKHRVNLGTTWKQTH